MQTSTLRSPFKFLDPYEKKDKDLFFGRDNEVEILFDYVNRNRVVLVYGQSGTGKTSIIKCGLANAFESTDWIPIFIRRDDNLNESLIKNLSKGVDEINEAEMFDFERKLFGDEPEVMIYDHPVIELKQTKIINEISASHKAITAKILFLIKKISEKYLRPVYLILDQFEELLILSDDEEKKLFIEILKLLVSQRITPSCHIIIVLREEYFAWLDPFEKEIPDIADRRMRVEAIRPEQGGKIIKNTLDKFSITLENPEENTQQIVDALARKGEISLPYLQIYLDQLWRVDFKRTYPDGYSGSKKNMPLEFTTDEIKEFGQIEEVLLRYVIECIAGIQSELKSKFLDSDAKFLYRIFDSIITDDGTKRPINYTIENGVYHFKFEKKKFQSTENAKLAYAFKLLESIRIVRDDGKNFELAHDILGPIILKVKQGKIIRPKLLLPTIIDNPYKGLNAYEQNDFKKFFGRERVVEELFKKFEQNNLIAVVGPSGSGKSSLIKAGLIPKLENAAYSIINIKPEDVLLSIKHTSEYRQRKSLDDLKKDILYRKNEKVVLYIDQFEQINTRCEDETQRVKFISFLNFLINDDNITSRAKVVLSIRSDYEFEFDLFFKEWKTGKFNVPPFLDEELRDVIIEPAYHAGLEFSPDYLADTIVREVQQSNGTLPLLSYTLFSMFEKYKDEGKKDGLLTEDIYNAVGGVIGGLQNRANRIYDEYPNEDPHRKTIRNVMLRMVAGDGERAGKKVFENDLDFDSDEENRRVKTVLNDYIESHLIITGKNEDGKVYYEPAHDSLIRNWVKMSEWISNNRGKDILYYTPILSEAVRDYQLLKKLWNDDPRLTTLQKIVESDDNWLNKSEYKFVIDSINKREEINIRKKSKDQERLNLIKDKLREQEKVTILYQEKIAEKTKVEELLKQKLAIESESVLLNKQRNTEQQRNNLLLERTRRGLLIALTTLILFGIMFFVNISAKDRKLLFALSSKDSAKNVAERKAEELKKSLRYSDSLVTINSRLNDGNSQLAKNYKEENVKVNKLLKKNKAALIRSLIDKAAIKNYAIELASKNRYKDSIILENDKFREKTNLQKEPFYTFKSDYLDSLSKERYLDTLIAFKFNERDTAKLNKFKNALNKLPKAFNEMKDNPNKGIILTKQAYNDYPVLGSIFDTIGLNIANNNLFYTNKIDLKYRLGSSIYLTAVSKDKKRFAFATLNGIQTGNIRNDSIQLNNGTLYYTNDDKKYNKQKNYYSDYNRFIRLSYDDDNNLLALSEERKLFKWDSNNLKAYLVKDLSSFINYDLYDYNNLSMSPNGKQIAYYNRISQSLELINLEVFKIVNIDSLMPKQIYDVNQLTYSPDSKQMLISAMNNKSYLINLENRTLHQIPDSSIFFSNFTSDSRYVFYQTQNSIFLYDINSDNIVDTIAQSYRGYNYLSGNFILSSKWQSLIEPAYSGGYNYIEKYNNYETDSIFEFQTKAKLTTTNSTLNNNVFDYISDNLILGYNRSTYKDSLYNYNLLILKKFGKYTSFSNAYENIKPFLTESDKKDLGLIKLTEMENYEKALDYLEQSSSYSLSQFSQLQLLKASKQIMDSLLFAKPNTYKYLYYSKQLESKIFKMDSIFTDRTNNILAYVKIEEKYISSKSTDTTSDMYNVYKKELARDYGNLSYYLAFSDSINSTKIIEYANKALSLDSSRDYVYTNIALAYLLSKDFVNAKKVYSEFKGKYCESLKEGFSESFLKDLNVLERKRVISDQHDQVLSDFVQNLKCWLSNKGCKL